MKKIISIVITYNGMAWIEKCLNSLAKSSFPSTILVIDNGSADGTVSFIRERFPFIQLIETGKNLGFGQANNIGMQIAIDKGADHVFLLNQDAWVEPDTISQLVRIQAGNTDYGIVSPLHFDGAGQALDKYFAKYLAGSEASHTTSETLIDIPFVNAAAWMISSACLRSTGGFDPVFFHYGEDINYTQRVLFRGFKVGVYSGAKIFHDRGERISNPKPDAAARLKGEWIHFLNQVCDIRNKHYREIMLKRSLRYGLTAIVSFISFNKKDFLHYYKLSRKIITSGYRVRRSRKIAASDRGSPYLK